MGRVVGVADDMGYKLHVQVGNVKWHCVSQCLIAAPDVKTVG